jgi:hypothetical protein
MNISDSKLKEVYENLLYIYGEEAAHIRFRMYCITRGVGDGYSDFRSLEIILDNVKMNKMAVECYLHYDNPEKFPDNPVKVMEAVHDGYRLLLRKALG